ncbi:MAG: C39 family peptidase, partial [Planctomycetes bacterium]|nr:C39 family peptidase [Planctomycetota bacterium]
QPTPTPPIRFTLTGLRHEHQGWNNCGPTTLAMALSYWGRGETQYDVAPVLKPDPEDKNVSPWEMEAYARGLGLGAIVRVGGTLDGLKSLVRAGFPVVVETWYVRDARDQLGHYRLIIGYDDAAQEFLTYDSLHGPDVTIGYQELDELWRVFNRAYLVVHTLERWEPLAAILGPDLDDAVMYEQALETARVEALTMPESCVAYADCADWVTFSRFSAGSSLTSLGQHAEAVVAYDQARQLRLHYRMLWYQFGPYESYHAVGRYDDVIALAGATLATANNLEESYYWRGMARLAQGNTGGARADFEAALRYHENWPPAVIALAGMAGSP